MCVGDRVGVVTDAVFVLLLPFPEDTKRHVCLLSLKQVGWYFFQNANGTFLFIIKNSYFEVILHVLSASLSTVSYCCSYFVEMCNKTAFTICRLGSLPLFSTNTSRFRCMTRSKPMILSLYLPHSNLKTP